MTEGRQRRVWVLIAAIAICIVLVLTLVPQSHSGSAGGWIAILPIFFVGVISPLGLLSAMAYMYLGRTPDDPVRPASYQRPPPVQLT